MTKLMTATWDREMRGPAPPDATRSMPAPGGSELIARQQGISAVRTSVREPGVAPDALTVEEQVSTTLYGDPQARHRTYATQSCRGRARQR